MTEIEKVTDFNNGKVTDFNNGKVTDFNNGKVTDFNNGKVTDFNNWKIKLILISLFDVIISLVNEPRRQVSFLLRLNCSHFICILFFSTLILQNLSLFIQGLHLFQFNNITVTVIDFWLMVPSQQFNCFVFYLIWVSYVVYCPR